MRHAIAILLVFALLCGGLCCAAEEDGESGAIAAAKDVAQRAAGDSAPIQDAGGEVTYTVRVEDQHGEPVPGVAVTFCSDTSCVPAVSDADGVIAFTGAPYAYHVMVVEAPDGYDDASVDDFTTDAQATPMTVVIQKLN